MLPTSISEVGLPYITSKISSWFRKINKGSRGIITTLEVNNPKDFKPHHIYITVDVELDKNDWVIDVNSDDIFKLQDQDIKSCRRIIASTDKSLNLCEIDPIFIEKICSLNLEDSLIECDDEYIMGATTSRAINSDEEIYIKLPINLITKSRKFFL